LKLVITGAGGQVGREVAALAAMSQIDCHEFQSKELDITREARVARYLRRARPDIVVNAAGYTAVDQAEDEAEACYAVNRDGVHNLAKACSRLQVPLIHLSTDYVFDGDKDSAYLEDDLTGPLSIYGKSKLDGESVLAATWEDHIILRVSWVFSEWQTNFVKSMRRLIEEKAELNVVEDQIGAPTPATDIARVIVAIANQLNCGSKARGIYHYCGKEIVSWYEFANLIREALRPLSGGTLAEINPIKSADYPFKAQRPVNSQLACQKILDTFGIKQRSWTSEMERVLHFLCAEEVSES